MAVVERLNRGSFKKLVKKPTSKSLTPEQKNIANSNIQLAYYFGGNSKLRPFRMSQEEWVSECLWLLVKCARCFDPSIGFRFSTYYSRSVFGHRAHCVKKCVSRNEYTWEGDPMCTPFDDATAQGCDPTTSMDGEGNNWLLANLRANIPVQYRDGFDYWLRRFNGESATQIAKSLGVSRQAVCQRCERAMRAMRVYARRERLVLE